MNEQVQAVLILAGLILGIVFIVAGLIWLLRGLLWKCSFIFFALDGIMWFTYNPLRGAFKNHSNDSGYTWYMLSLFFLVKPIWQILAYIITTPIRISNALYFDVLMYLFVMFADTVSEVFNPKRGKIRHKTGINYAVWWVLGLPIRLVYFIAKNSLAIVDSVMMFIMSVIWPTFTMYHGSRLESTANISQSGKWFVGGGNFGGSGIYFARTIRAARHYSMIRANRGDEANIVIARVTFTMLKNASTLSKDEKRDFARGGEAGKRLANKVGFPFYAIELWRSDRDTQWWEYVLLRGGEDGEFVRSWRIRPVGLLKTRGDGSLSGTLARLWGGKAHYSLSVVNWVMMVLSLVGTVYLLLVSFSN